MCGIAGLFLPPGLLAAAPDRDRVQAMTDLLEHRGPDGAGYHVGPRIALGHRRLAVIDLVTGEQPIYNEDRRVVVVYNGEIYNYRELVVELEAAGHRFHTRSDTEVIVHAWEQWGPSCVDRFRGMFAFALHDERAGTLFLARDRLGVKPLYYGTLADGTFAFASELKALTGLAGADLRIDPAAVEDYFAYGYVPDPRSIYTGFRKLPPAHTLTWPGHAKAPSIARYWDVRFETVDASEPELAEHLRELIDDAVRLRMVADVPVGAFLSGGVDSSVVVSAMARLSAAPIRTCAIGFDVPEFDETRFARMVAQRYGTDHTEHRVSSDDFALLDRLVDIFDEPFADSSALPTFRVCEAARRRVTVALSGDGGDETFAGYRRYRMHLAEERVRAALPLALRGPLFGMLARLYPKADRLPRFLRAKTTLRAISQDTVYAYHNSVAAVDADARRRIFSPRLVADLGGYRAVDLLRAHAARAATDDPLALAQYLDYQTWLAGRMNVKVDRCSMANSLEVREPLMDHRLVEWAATLPTWAKLRGGEAKYRLKRAYEPHLPREVLYRDKMGFAIPLARWLRGPLAGRLRTLVASESIGDCGLFDPTRLRQMAEEHIAGSRDWSAPLWTIVVFAGFLERSRPGTTRRQSAPLAVMTD